MTFKYPVSSWSVCAQLAMTDHVLTSYGHKSEASASMIAQLLLQLDRVDSVTISHHEKETKQGRWKISHRVIVPA